MRKFQKIVTFLMAFAMLFAIALPVCAKEDGDEKAENGYDRGYVDGTKGSGELYAHGLDVSEWQGDSFDFEAVKAAGYSYVIIRAGVTLTRTNEAGVKEYITREDYYFQKNYEKARAAGLDIGTYFYSMAKTPEEAVKEAETLLGYIEGKKFEYPVYLDFEDNTVRESINSNGALAKPICEAFMDRIADAGYLAGMYSGGAWIDGETYSFAWMPKEADELGEKYEIWIANYYNSGTYERKGQEYSSRYGMYQYTSSKRIEGYDGKLDANICYKDYPYIVKKYGFNGYDADDGAVESKAVGAAQNFDFGRGSYKITSASSKVSLYSEPDINKPSGLFADNRTVVEVIDSTEVWNKKWVKIKFDGGEGWIDPKELSRYYPQTTEEKTDKATEKNDVEDVFNEDDGTPDKGGCGSAISVLPTALICLAGAFAALKRKEK